LRNSFKCIVVFCFCYASSYAQQLPYFTQNIGSNFITNPAITGTKRIIDARANYRMQWVGYDGAPTTSSIGLHGRFMKGKMGAGLYMMQDKIGPSKQTNLGVSYAYHIRFSDCELSTGVAGNFTKYTLTGNNITLRNTLDPAVDQSITNSTWVSDVNAGIYLYNDRFHLGGSVLHALQSTAEFYKEDTSKIGKIKYVDQANFTVGYNYSKNPDFIFENSVYVNYVKGGSLVFDYTLRVHYLQKVFAGVSIRLKDAIGFHIGYTFKENYQISYSYDLNIGKLRSYTSGSHELMIALSRNLGTNQRGRVSDKFLHQKYGYLF
jgi:type IX secretion system PorP/SprF family membrane protein